MIEIIATTLEDAKRIEEAGADRIELVCALQEGGLTPSYGLIKKAVQSVTIPINVMIRPHANSFIYTEDEIALMIEDIIITKELKVNGVVFGVLNKNNEICIHSLEKLLKVCEGIDVTFHKAIDELANPVQGIEILRKYGQIKTVLTSGGKGDILKNVSVIKRMIEEAEHINILLGGGLGFNNVKEIMEATKAPEYHFGTAVRYDKSTFGKMETDKVKELVDIVNI